MAVLLVDDALVETMALWLNDDGRWVTDVATTGETALVKLDSTADVVVLDRELPDVTGSEILDETRDAGFDGAVVVPSAFEPHSSLPAHGVDEYLVKPVRREDLIAALERLVGR